MNQIEIFNKQYNMRTGKFNKIKKIFLKELLEFIKNKKSTNSFGKINLKNLYNG